MFHTWMDSPVPTPPTNWTKMALNGETLGLDYGCLMGSAATKVEQFRFDRNPHSAGLGYTMPSPAAPMWNRTSAPRAPRHISRTPCATASLVHGSRWPGLDGPRVPLVAKRPSLLHELEYHFVSSPCFFVLSSFPFTADGELMCNGRGTEALVSLCLPWCL